MSTRTHEVDFNGFNMANTLDRLEGFIAEAPTSNPAISAWSVGMQIHHALLATIHISQFLTDSTPGEKKQSFSVPRSLILLTGKIPRGRGKAPKRSLPNQDITAQDLDELLTRARTVLDAASQSDPACWWKHFAFGVMRRDTAIKFIHVHNRHHLSIITDIIDSP